MGRDRKDADSRSVTRAIRQALKLMPRDGDLDGFLANIGRHRGRTVHLMPGDLGDPTNTPSGLWLASETNDYIVFDRRVTLSSRAVIVCHEIAHMLLDHMGDLHVALVAPDLDPRISARLLAARHDYTTIAERDAEHMGTVLAAEHSRRQELARLNRNTFSARMR